MIIMRFARVVLMLASLVASADVEVSHLLRSLFVLAKSCGSFAFASLVSWLTHLWTLYHTFARLGAAFKTFRLTVLQKNVRLEKLTMEKTSTAHATPQCTFRRAWMAKSLLVLIATIAATNFTKINSLITILIRGVFNATPYNGCLRKVDAAPALPGDTVSLKADVSWMKWPMIAKSGCEMEMEATAGFL